MVQAPNRELSMHATRYSIVKAEVLVVIIGEQNQSNILASIQTNTASAEGLLACNKYVTDKVIRVQERMDSTGAAP